MYRLARRSPWVLIYPKPGIRTFDQSMPLLSTSGIGITYGADVIFANINVEINERARIGIVGPNGGGKTSLLEIFGGGL